MIQQQQRRSSRAVGSFAQSATTDRHYFHTVVKGRRLGVGAGLLVVEKVKVKPTIKTQHGHSVLNVTILFILT